MSFNLDQLDIIPSLYDHFYEPNDITTGIESTLINIGITLGRAGVSLNPLNTHFNSAKEFGIRRAPTLVMVTDTRRHNELNYLAGTISISHTESGKPHIAIGVQQYWSQRYHDLERGWVDEWKVKHCEAHLTVDQPETSHVEMTGADFKPEDFANGNLAAFLETLSLELKEMILALPVFTDAIDEKQYRMEVLKALGGNTINDIINPAIKYNAPWSLVGWDSDVKFLDLVKRFHQPFIELN